MNIVIRKTSEEVDTYASFLMASRIMSDPNLVMALATGNTTKSLYTAFVDLVQKIRLQTTNTYGFAVDEYLGIEADDEISCGLRLTSAFVNTGIMDTSHLIAPNDFHYETMHAVCDAYELSIKNLGGIDLQVLGIGTNGHLGFNEPGTPFSSSTHIVSLTQQTRAILAKKYNKETVDKIPKKGITMGLKTIMQSKEIILLIKGNQKSSIASKLISGPLTEDMPASILQLHPNCTVILDEEAAQSSGKE